MSNCIHKYMCVDTRPKGSYRLRSYKCSHCGIRHSSVEVRVSDTSQQHSNVAAHLGNLIVRVAKLKAKYRYLIYDILTLIEGTK